VGYFQKKQNEKLQLVETLNKEIMYKDSLLVRSETKHMEIIKSRDLEIEALKVDLDKTKQQFATDKVKSEIAKLKVGNCVMLNSYRNSQKKIKELNSLKVSNKTLDDNYKSVSQMLQSKNMEVTKLNDQMKAFEKKKMEQSLKDKEKEKVEAELLKMTGENTILTDKLATLSKEVLELKIREKKTLHEKEKLQDKNIEYLEIKNESEELKSKLDFKNLEITNLGKDLKDKIEKIN